MNDLVNRIANGEATLLGVEEICKRLGVSRSTFERWVRNGGGKTGNVSLAAVAGASLIGQSVQGLQRLMDGSDNINEGSLTFPPPDIRIGNSPKWELETFKRWLKANVTAGSTGSK